MPYSIAAEEWHCVELHFDGPGQTQSLYIGGEELINATGYPGQAMSFTHFKFGYNALHGTERELWYDDLAVAPTRLGCLE